MFRMTGLVGGLVLALSATTAPVASAAAYTERGGFTYDTDPYVLSNFCSFDLSVVSHLVFTYEYIEVPSGVAQVQQVHITELDAVTGPGATLVGLPYRFNELLRYDVNGNLVGNTSAGGVSRFVLPDGSMFWSAGRADFMTGGGGGLTPEVGHSGNTAALCAAVS